MIVLEARQTPSRLMLWMSPLLAAGLTLLAGAVLMAALGRPPIEALKVYFLSPFADAYSRSEILVKAIPLAIIAAGLAACFRANVWNIGAAGQYVLGAVGAGWVALSAPDDAGIWLLPACLIAGTACGALWASVPAVLKARLGASEILVSLMMVYIAEQLLDWLVRGPWRDPYSFGFPQTPEFPMSAWAPVIVPGTRLHAGLYIAIAVSLVLALLMARGLRGFSLRAQGAAPRAAAFGGFSPQGGIWTALLLSGGLAGLAGAVEATATLQKLQPDIALEYGFVAIIAAFVGRLNPIGAALAACVLAVSFIGGENAQILLKTPKNVTGLFQGMLLFFLLACDTLIHYRLRFTRPQGVAQRLKTAWSNAGSGTSRRSKKRGLSSDVEGPAKHKPNDFKQSEKRSLLSDRDKVKG